MGLEDQASFLYEKLSSKYESQWANYNLQHVDIPQCAAVWIPNGWYAAAVHRPGAASHVGLVIVPFMTKALATRCPSCPACSELMAAIVAEGLNKQTAP